jgi:xanthine dehydrogenase accessory factor
MLQQVVSMTRCNSLQRLLALFEHERARCASMVMATVLRTSGPTYSKSGALMLIGASGEYAGILSGGCLEGDLLERSRRVLLEGIAQRVTYDMRGPDDLLFGLGSGCEGAMEILLQRLDVTGAWQPMQGLVDAWYEQRPQSMLLVASSSEPGLPCGSGVFGDTGVFFGTDGANQAAVASLLTLAIQHTSRGLSQYLPEALPGIDVLTMNQAAPTQILLLGAGPDAVPVAQLTGLLGWQTTVIDHRPYYARASRFPTARAVLDTGPEGLGHLLETSPAAFDAAIIMSHHLASDLAYLRAIAPTGTGYVGLLGPVSRRERLLAELGPVAVLLRSRLRAPVGLDLGADNSESIALAIVAEIQGALAGRASVGPMSLKPA